MASAEDPEFGESMLNRIVIGVIVVGVLSGCSALPSPQEASSSAIIGELNVEFDKNWRIFRSGRHINRVQVRLENIDSGHTHSAYTNQDGVYSFANISPGYYSISSWEIDKSTNSERWVIVGNVGGSYIDLSAGELVFAPEVLGTVTVLSNTEFKFQFGSEVSEPDIDKLVDFVESENEDWLEFTRDQ